MRDEDLIKSLSSRLEKLSGKKIALLTHSGGDPDSIGSAFVLSNILKSRMHAETLFKIPSETSTYSKVFLERLGLEQSEELEDAETLIILDCGSPEQLDDFLWVLDSGREILVIDHHSTSPESFKDKAEVFSSEIYQSVCEIIYDLARYLGYELDLREAEALFAGFYYDTVRFVVADEETLRKACELARLGVNPREFLSTLEIKMDISERIARLKSALRMSIYRIGDWVIVTSRVSSFQSSSARSLVGLGAHVAMVAGESDEGVTVSFRALKDFIEETGVNLGKDIAARVGAELGGYGGGHASAAKAYCRRESVEEVLRRCVELISEKLGAPAEQVKD